MKISFHKCVDRVGYGKLYRFTNVCDAGVRHDMNNRN